MCVSDGTCVQADGTLWSLTLNSTTNSSKLDSVSDDVGNNVSQHSSADSSHDSSADSLHDVTVTPVTHLSTTTSLTAAGS